MRTMIMAGMAVGVAFGVMAQEAARPGLGPPIEIHRDLSDKEWPQLQNTPQRTGYAPVSIHPPFQELWRVNLDELDVDNKIARVVQPIVAEGKVFLGCKNGRFFALDAKTGKVVWTFDAGGAVVHTAGYAAGKVFVAAFDGRVYALDSSTGKQTWLFTSGRRHGFGTAVLLVGDKVYAVDRGGRLFCLTQSDGKEVWHYDAEAPVDQSPAYDDGNVFFCDEAMRAHAVAAETGRRVWISKHLPGLTFHQFWPVVVHGKVIVRPYNGWLSESAWTPGFHKNMHSESQWSNPGVQTLVLLNEKTGEEEPAIEHYTIGMMSGPPPPPAVTRDGLLVSRWSGLGLDPKNSYAVAGGEVPKPRPPYGQCWVLQDIRLGAGPVLPLEPTYVPDSRLRAVPGDIVAPLAVGIGPPDETTACSVLGNLVACFMSMGWRDYGVGGKGLMSTYYSKAHGIYDLAGHRWRWEGIDWAWVHGNQFSGGVSAVSGADGRFYNISYNYVQCHVPAQNQ